MSGTLFNVSVKHVLCSPELPKCFINVFPRSVKKKKKRFKNIQGVDVLTAQNKMFAEATRLAELCFISKSFQAMEMFSWKILPFI